jgi:hypothetical protein
MSSRFFLLALALLSPSLGGAQVKQGSWTPVSETMERGYSSLSYQIETVRPDFYKTGEGKR